MKKYNALKIWITSFAFMLIILFWCLALIWVDLKPGLWGKMLSIAAGLITATTILTFRIITEKKKVRANNGIKYDERIILIGQKTDKITIFILYILLALVGIVSTILFYTGITWLRIVSYTIMAIFVILSIIRKIAYAIINNKY